MHHAVYGTGYLATVVSSCLADFGLPVTCFHEDVPRIASLARDETPYYEKNEGSRPAQCPLRPTRVFARRRTHLPQVADDLHRSRQPGWP